jgi:hypothetical protein
VLVVVEDGMFIRSRQMRSTMKQSGALMSSRLMPPKDGSSAQTMSASFLGVDVRPRWKQSIGEFLEQHRLALHHRLGRQRADIAEAQHGGAVGDDGNQVARPRRSASHRDGNARGIGERQIALRRHRLWSG